jgi:hypothetical protein
MIFAAHPIHAESVCFIIGRTDSLATLFLIPGVLCALRYRERGDRLALLGAPVCFLLALLCKEVAVTQLVLLPLLYRFAPYGGRAFGVREPTAGDGPPRPSGWHLRAGISSGRTPPPSRSTCCCAARCRDPPACPSRTTPCCSCSAPRRLWPTT